MAEPENLKRLSPLETAYINFEFLKYMEHIAPTIIQAMAEDETTTFLFKIGGSDNDRSEDAGN